MTYFITDTDRTNALLDALEAREHEREHYQTNITNFRLAIVKLKAIPGTDAIAAFIAELEGRSTAEEIGLFRTQTILDVILDQLEGRDIPALIAARPKKE